MHDDGSLYFNDAEGTPLPSSLAESARKQNREEINGLLERSCEQANARIDALVQLHYSTPSPNTPPIYSPTVFDVERPQSPVPLKHGFLAFFLRSRRQRIDATNAARMREYQEAVEAWGRDKERFDGRELDRRHLIEEGIYKDTQSMEQFLEETFQAIEWPRETIVSIDVQMGGARVLLDVDLPEIEDMPAETASVARRDQRLASKPMSDTQRQRLYMNHVHSVGFRLLGEAFAALPICSEVVLSGFSQRPSRTTGQIGDDYLFSIKATRSAWLAIDFENLGLIDVVDAFTRFDLRREMTKTGRFKTIIPFD